MKKILLKKKVKILEVIRTLKTNTSKKHIMNEVKNLFYDKHFLNKLDTNEYLIGFENGIYDLKHSVFRDGRPDDYVSMTTGINLIEFDEDHKHWPGLQNFINTVFPEEHLRKYFLTYLSTCLQGFNNEEKFRIWIGTGANGKSKIEELFNKSFGEYCMKFPITLLTGKRAASNACSPEVIRSKGKRFCYFEEPNSNERINTGRLKEYTGGDKIEGRGLYQTNIEFKPQFKLAVLTNYLFEIPAEDQGIWRRMEVIEFKSKFTDKKSDWSKPFHFPMDKSISEKIPNWTELFMSLLINKYYQIYKHEGLIVPDEITKIYQRISKECDIHNEFIDEIIDETGKHSDVILIKELYEQFKIWYDDQHNDNKCSSLKEFKKYLSSRYGKNNVKSKKLYGCLLKKELQVILCLNMNQILNHLVQHYLTNSNYFY